MLTFFTTAKPFREHNGIIQRNALKSWTLLHPDVEVILFGDDEGAAQAARELGVLHEPHAEKNESGSNRMDTMFLRAQEIARHDILCYSNCDIVLMDDFLAALGRVKAAHAKFLMVGRRWDTEIKEPYAFERNDWRSRLRNLALREGQATHSRLHRLLCFFARRVWREFAAARCGAGVLGQLGGLESTECEATCRGCFGGGCGHAPEPRLFACSAGQA
jgi:hypothetical protein